MKQITVPSFQGPQEMDRVEGPEEYWTGAHAPFEGLTKILREEVLSIKWTIFPSWPPSLAQKEYTPLGNIAWSQFSYRLRESCLFSETLERKHKHLLHSYTNTLALAEADILFFKCDSLFKN